MKIIFKAKSLDDYQWVKGSYLASQPINDYIKTQAMLYVYEGDAKHRIVHVDEKTVCQYTGLDDAKSEGIYRGDILSLEITKELIESSFSHSKLAKTVKEKDVTRVLLYINKKSNNINLEYEVFFEIKGKLNMDKDKCPIVEAFGDDSLFIRYLIEKGAVIVGNIFDNPGLLNWKVGIEDDTLCDL